MKRKLAIICALIGLATAAIGQTEPKVVVVDMTSLLRQYYKARQAFERFETSVNNANEEMRLMQEELERMLEPVPDLRARAENRNQQFSEDAVRRAQEELNRLSLDFQQRREELLQFQQQTQERLAQREQQIINLHLKEIRDVVSDFAQSGGYDMVLNSATGVVYSRTAMDKTESVLSILNADAPRQ